MVAPHVRSIQIRPGKRLAVGSRGKGRTNMVRTLGATALLALAAVMPVQPVAAQNPLGGAIIGGAVVVATIVL